MARLREIPTLPLLDRPSSLPTVLLLMLFPALLKAMLLELLASFASIRLALHTPRLALLCQRLLRLRGRPALSELAGGIALTALGIAHKSGFLGTAYGFAELQATPTLAHKLLDFFG